MDLIFEIIGWLGVILLLIAYGAISQGRLTNQNLSFHLLNLFGALGIIINAMHHGAYAPAGLNIVWAAVATWGVYQITLGKK